MNISDMQLKVFRMGLRRLRTGHESGDRDMVSEALEYLTGFDESLSDNKEGTREIDQHKTCSTR